MEKREQLMREISRAALATQKALLGMVTPELRSVILNIDETNSSFYIRFYYDRMVSENVLHRWEEAISKASSELGSRYSLDSAIERLDYPMKIPFQGRIAYLRKE